MLGASARPVLIYPTLLKALSGEPGQFPPIVPELDMRSPSPVPNPSVASMRVN